MQELENLPPIFTAHLFPKIENLLIELLDSLEGDEWEKQTLAPCWKVKDVAAHLLDTQLRKLSLVRDNYVSEIPIISCQEDFVSFINALNHQGVLTYRRLSPKILVMLMKLASKESSDYHASLDPFAKATFAVSWAGEEESLNWFDTAREFTERWHHQQQIRLATDKPGIITRELYFPVLDTFMRALPFHYSNIQAQDNSLVQFTISGNCGGVWYLYKDRLIWSLIAQEIGEKIAEVDIPQEIAWRIFTKGIDKEIAFSKISFGGDKEIGSHVLSMLSIVG
jgi:hypothetical protein